MLTVYSKNYCSYCTQAKNYLTKNNIAFQEKNIENDKQAREFILAQGHRTLPQIYFYGSLFVDGGWQGLSKMSTQEIIQRIEQRTQFINGNL